MNELERKIIGQSLLMMMVGMVIVTVANVAEWLTDANAFGVLMLICALWIPVTALVASFITITKG